MKSAYDFFIRSTGKEIEEAFQNSGMTKTISYNNNKDFLLIFGLTLEKDLITSIKLEKFYRGHDDIQSIFIEFLWNDVKYQVKIQLCFSNSGEIRFDRFVIYNNIINEYQVELYGLQHKFYIPLSNYVNFIKPDEKNNNKSIEDHLKDVNLLVNEINYWASYYVNLFNSGKIVDSWNDLFIKKINFNENGDLKFIFEAQVRYLLYFNRRGFDLPTPEELHILYFWDVFQGTSHIKNKKDMLDFLYKDTPIEESLFHELLSSLIKERKEKLSIEKRYVKINKEFFLEVMKLKQEISGKYNIDPGWLKVDIYDCEKDLNNLSIGISNTLEDSPYNIGYFSSKEISESDTREGLNNLINKYV